MADRAHELTDEILNKLEGGIAREFAVAVREAEAKLRKYMEAFEAEDEIMKERLAAGKITKAEYQAWAYRRKMNGKHWEEMRDVLAEDMHHASEIALGMARKTMPDVYALNGNFGIYEVESTGGIYTGMALYNHDTAEYLLEQQRQLMPGPSTEKAAEIAANKDLQWNQKKIQSAVLQGILQGESAAGVAKRLMAVGQMDYNAAVRYARTMTTNAQNAGRYNSYQRAKKLGVDLTIEWQATLDGRTRHDHRMLHGQRREVDEPFVTSDGIEILWPAQSFGPGTSDIPQRMIWNCRCTLKAMVKGFERDTVTESEWMKANGMTFDEWQNARPEYATGKSKKQYEEYKKLLGKNAPSTFTAFQSIKNAGGQEWEALKARASIARYSSRKTVQTGGHHYTADKSSSKKDKVAVKAYEKLSRENDARLISINTGFKQSEIAQIRNHVFTRKHKLYEGYERFKPDYNMAVAWKRLRDGDYLPRDITLLKHELLESTLEKEYNLTAAEAHARATAVHDWWGQLVKEIGEEGEPDGLLQSFVGRR